MVSQHDSVDIHLLDDCRLPPLILSTDIPWTVPS